MKGRGSWRIRSLHEQYGPVIRIAPDELSYTTSGAWKTIYGQKTPEFSKCLDGRGIAPTSVNGVKSMMTEAQARHGRLRRAILPAFSERAVREQEGFLQASTDRLVAQLRRRRGRPQNVTKWFALAAFDVVADLAFGESPGCLEQADLPWLQVIGARAKSLVWFQVLMQLGLEPYMDRLMPRWAAEARRKHLRLTGEKVSARIARGAEGRKDFMSYILDNKAESLNNTELVIMASTFIVAGSGTAAGGLSGITYLLGNNPEKYKKLVDEIRGAFNKQEDITIQATSHCEYLKAVIDEGMRMYPPTPSTLPRWVPKGGQEIDGKWVPGGMAVGVNQFTAGHMEWNFKHARSFIPERWLESAKNTEFANDDKAAVQPFSYGPRSCIGKNMAYAEMRMVLAKLLLNFDFELLPGQDDWWDKQGTYLVWEKLPLMVNLHLRNDTVQG
ncbi:Cytochrome P450 monooxygenase alt3 [Neofusicoccum parvum]|uniref:Cytochrome P450 monooxygenase alt3 n=1 Tax=Neofusicoccum parvum TaxID=310453 RepID=A0ACB5SEP3_9PEZI|nr:Cytochrome P450 monooxygenase alt3 [Neofusicoccum parvum]